jgi:hypothetical protein
MAKESGHPKPIGRENLEFDDARATSPANATVAEFARNRQTPAKVPIVSLLTQSPRQEEPKKVREKSFLGTTRKENRSDAYQPKIGSGLIATTKNFEKPPQRWRVRMHSLATMQDTCKYWTQVTGLSLFLVAGNAAISYGQSADSGASAGAEASSGDGSTSAGAASSADAEAGPNDEGGVTASSEGTASGDATGGDVSASEPGISAEASATSGDTATAETSTSAGTSAEATAGDERDADAEGETVISKERRNKGYAIAYQDGAYSAAYYKKDTAYVASGIYSGETLTKKDARAIVHSGVEVGASADSDEASAYATSGTDASGSKASETSAASTRTRASAWANTDGAAGGTADADFSASVEDEE